MSEMGGKRTFSRSAVEGADGHSEVLCRSSAGTCGSGANAVRFIKRAVALPTEHLELTTGLSWTRFGVI